MELQYMYAGNPWTGRMSQAQVVECDADQGGCNGGYAPYAWDYIQRAGGLVTNAQYPYPSFLSIPSVTPPCQPALLANPVLDTSGVTDYLPIPTTLNETRATETAIMDALVGGKPVVIGVSGGSACFQGYRATATTPTPVLTCDCGTALDHTVLIIGWTETNWILRNQWGTSWGIGGYALLPRLGTTDMVLPPGGQCGMCVGVSVQRYTHARAQLSRQRGHAGRRVRARARRVALARRVAFALARRSGDSDVDSVVVVVRRTGAGPGGRAHEAPVVVRRTGARIGGRAHEAPVASPVDHVAEHQQAVGEQGAQSPPNDDACAHAQAHRAHEASDCVASGQEEERHDLTFMSVSRRRRRPETAAFYFSIALEL